MPRGKNQESSVELSSKGALQSSEVLLDDGLNDGPRKKRVCVYIGGGKMHG